MLGRKIQSLEADTNRVIKDILQSSISLAWISFFLAIGDCIQYNGNGLEPFAPSLYSNFLSFTASLLLFDTWFYWFHRLLHTKLFYRKIHHWHHLSRPPTVWANNSDTFLDTFFLQSYWIFIHFFIPISIPVVMCHKLFDQISGMLGHSGYEYVYKSQFPFLRVSHHDQHHQYFNYNFATHFIFWDRLMGTLHPSYDNEIYQTLSSKSKKYLIEKNEKNNL